MLGVSASKVLLLIVYNLLLFNKFLYLRQLSVFIQTKAISVKNSKINVSICTCRILNQGEGMRKNEEEEEEEKKKNKSQSSEIVNLLQSWSFMKCL